MLENMDSVRRQSMATNAKGDGLHKMNRDKTVSSKTIVSSSPLVEVIGSKPLDYRVLREKIKNWNNPLKKTDSKSRMRMRN